MASVGYLESLLNTLPEQIRKPLVAFSREAFKSLRFGALEDEPVAAENFGGHLVPVTTASVADDEVAVEHRLERTPRLVIPMLDPTVVNAHLPAITMTQAADTKYLYFKSATTDASFHLYVE